MKERAIYVVVVMPSPGKDVRKKALDRKARITETNSVYFIMFYCFVLFSRVRYCVL